MASRLQTLRAPAVRSMNKALAAQQARSLGSSPPTPPFARNLAPTTKLVEDHELVWDDGVAPELTIDFDSQHVSTGEGLAWWLGGLGFFTGLFQFCKTFDMEGNNPAVNRKADIVGDFRNYGGKDEDMPEIEGYQFNK